MFKWLYNFIFVDFHNDKPSHTKFWSHIGYGAIIYSYTTSATLDENWFWATMAIGGIVVGNKTVLKLFENKGLKNG